MASTSNSGLQNRKERPQTTEKSLKKLKEEVLHNERKTQDFSVTSGAPTSRCGGDWFDSRP